MIDEQVIQQEEEDTGPPVVPFAFSVTMDGIRVSAASGYEMIDYLLHKKDPFKYVLTGTFANQDHIEVSRLLFAFVFSL